MKIFITLFLFALPLLGQAKLIDHNVFYINGVNTDETGAEFSKRQLAIRLNYANVRLLYNTRSGSLIEDVAETATVRNAAREQGLNPFAFAFGVFFGTIDLENSSQIAILNELRSRATNVNQADTTVRDDLNRWMTIINPIRSADPASKLLFVGHSEGTALSNFLYDRIPEISGPRIPAKATCIRQTSVALIDDDVRNGNYVTSFGDRVINAAFQSPFLFNPPISTHRPDPSRRNSDFTGHFFIESYLEDSVLREAIMKAVDDQAAISTEQCVVPARICESKKVGTLDGLDSSIVVPLFLGDEPGLAIDLQLNTNFNNTNNTALLSTSPQLGAGPIFIQGDPDPIYNFSGIREVDTVRFSVLPEIFTNNIAYLHLVRNEPDGVLNYCFSCAEEGEERCTTDPQDPDLGFATYDFRFVTNSRTECGACIRGSASTRVTNACGSGHPPFIATIVNGVALSSNSASRITLSKGQQHIIEFQGVCRCSASSVPRNNPCLEDPVRPTWDIREVLQPELGLRSPLSTTAVRPDQVFIRGVGDRYTFTPQ